MKKVFKSFVFLAVTAMALYSCQKVIDQVENPEKEIDQVDNSTVGDYIYNFAISNVDNTEGTDSKATLGSDGSNVYLKWEDNDSFGAYSTDGANNSNNRPSTVSVSGDTFTLKVASTVELASGSSVYTYFPYNSGAGTSKTSVTIKIDPVQTQKATGFDASVMPMAGEPYTTTTTLEKDAETPVGEIHFANLGAIIEFNIYATSAIEEQIKSVQLNSTSGNPAGNFTLNLTTVDFSDDSTLELQGSGSAASVKTNLETPVAIPVSTTVAKEGTKVYMSVDPGDYAGSVVVTTTGHTYTFNVNSAKTFNRSKVKRLNANLSTAEVGDLPVEESWEVVTSASDFTEGTYVIVSSDKASYLVNATKDTNPSSAAAHWDAGGNLTSVTDDAKWIATTSGTGLQFASYAKNTDILWMSTTKAQGVTVGFSSSVENAASVWSLSANASLGGESGFLATTGGSRYLALYTNGTWRGYTINSTSGYLNNDSDIKAAIFYKLVDNSPKVSGTAIAFSSPVAGTLESTLTATNLTNASFSVVSKPDFVSSATVSGNTLTVTTANNYTLSANEGNIVVRATGDQGTVDGNVNVTQAASVFSASSTDDLLFDYDDTTPKSVTITSSFALTEADNLDNSNDTDFLATLTHVSETTYQYLLEVMPVDENNSDSDYTGIVTISRNGLEIPINVTQKYDSGTPVDVTGTWATWGSTTAFTVSSNTVYSKVAADFCGTNATLKAFNSAGTAQTITAGNSSTFYFAYFNAAGSSYWQIDLPVTEKIPSGTKLTLSYYHAVNSRGITSWTVSCNDNAIGDAVTINVNGSPTSTGDMTYVEKSYTTTADISSGSTITFKITAGSGTAKNNRITQISVVAE